MAVTVARGRFALVGEPIVAVDLINTAAVPGSRVADDLLSMIFVAVNPRRSWCTPGVCGNRVRVARHYGRPGGS